MKIFILVLTVGIFGSLSNAADMTEKESRQKMAEMHQQMADCLKSDKTMDECHGEMRTSCLEFRKSMPMMKDGMMPGKKGMMHKSGMMGGYPGMMSGFCGGYWMKDSQEKEKPAK